MYYRAYNDEGTSRVVGVWFFFFSFFVVAIARPSRKPFLKTPPPSVRDRERASERLRGDGVLRACIAPSGKTAECYRLRRPWFTPPNIFRNPVRVQWYIHTVYYTQYTHIKHRTKKRFPRPLPPPRDFDTRRFSLVFLFIPFFFFPLSRSTRTPIPPAIPPVPHYIPRTPSPHQSTALSNRLLVWRTNVSFYALCFENDTE